MNKVKVKARGYVSSSKINGSSIPQQVQNMAIRDYCLKKNYEYILSAVEYATTDSVFSLVEALEEKYSDIIIFYSLHQLPKNKIERNKIYNLIIKKKKVEFAIENIQIETKNNINKTENIISIEQIMRDYKNFYKKNNLNQFIDK
tara:strand:- start:10842 stop:11276 length:435 start_codon:yes stop_codon:yes gene_type:complete